MARRHPNAGGLALLIVTTFSVGLLAAPSVTWDREKQVTVSAAEPGERPRSISEFTVGTNAPPEWLLPSAAAGATLLGALGVAASRERNPPARL